MDMLVSGNVDGVEGAFARHQQLTVEQEWHGEKIHGEQVNVIGHKAHSRAQMEPA